MNRGAQREDNLLAFEKTTALQKTVNTNAQSITNKPKWRGIMSRILLTGNQSSVVAQADSAVEVCDSEGNLLGSIVRNGERNGKLCRDEWVQLWMEWHFDDDCNTRLDFAELTEGLAEMCGQGVAINGRVTCDEHDLSKQELRQMDHTTPTGLLRRFVEQVQQRLDGTGRELTVSDLRLEVRAERLREYSDWQFRDLDAIEDEVALFGDDTRLTDLDAQRIETTVPPHGRSISRPHSPSHVAWM